MSQPRDILVITTPRPANVDIEKHLKPVTSHVVAGTNIFSDVFASWSDIFGGRSKSYQNQLTSLYNEAIERLQLEAYQLGADCIVGLKIDIDEISGNGKSMFMITAIGTATILKKKGDNSNRNISTSGGVSVSQIEDMKIRREYIKKASTDDLELTEEVWNYLIKNRVTEIYPYLLKTFGIYFDDHKGASTDFYESLKNNLRSYIFGLKRDKQIDLMYGSLMQEDLGVSTRKLLFGIIKESNLLDFQKVLELLNSNDLNVNKIGLKVLQYDKPYYNYDDLIELERISDIITNSFEKRGQYTTKKAMLTGKEVEVWECSCSKKNNLDIVYCVDCQKDIYGFYKEEVNPRKAQEIIIEKIDLIKSLLPQPKSTIS